MKVKIYKVFIFTGTALLLLAAGLAGQSLLDEHIAARSARLVLEQLQTGIALTEAGADTQPGEGKNAAVKSAATPEPVKAAQAEPEVAPEAIAAEDAAAEAEESAPEAEEPVAEAPAAAVVYDAVGVLSVPKIKLVLPVLADCTPSLLKAAPCKYMGTAEGRPERLVIAGHNYRSHFGKLPQLEAGDEVVFTDISGNEYRYSVSESIVIDGDEHWELDSGEWDISLFTCTIGGKNRVLVRCLEQDAYESASVE